MNPYFGFLFARPSWVEGLARAFDLGGTLQEYNTAPTPEEADSIAMNADWRVVGQDLLRAMNELSEETKVAIGDEVRMKARAMLEGRGVNPSNGR